MRRSTSDRIAPVLILGGALAAFPTAAGHFFARDKVAFGGDLHFAGVGVTALAATVAAVVLTVIGARRRDGRTVLIGTAFSVMAALLALHGIATPGVLMGDNGVVSFTGGATLPIGGAILALAALPQFRRPGQVRPLLIAQAILLLAVLALGLTGIAFPMLVPAVPEPRSASALLLLVVGLGFYGALAWRALRTFLLTHRHADMLVVIGIAWLAAALPPAMLLHWWELGWWLGHLFELIGIGIVGVPVALDLRRSASSRPLTGDLSACDLVNSEEAFLGAHVRALMVSLAQKDEYTEEHTRRVALRAVQVGEELGLSAGRLRALATGALVHDIGKLSIPDAVLQKPGPLTDDEFELVRRHPEWGERMLRELGGFQDQVLRLVHDHHERLDGSGYPQGLSATELDLDTRILAVCDVYDALISTRVYRAAWSAEKALGFLFEQAGTAFDARCVEALSRVLQREAPPLRAAV